jgi:putative redox protein
MAEPDSLHAHFRENGESIYAVDIAVSGHRLKDDESLKAGGANLDPSPYDLLLAALGECTATTVRWYAQRKGWKLEKVEVRLTHRKEQLAGNAYKTDIFAKDVILHGSLDAEQRAKLVEIAGKCPVQRTPEGTPPLPQKLRNKARCSRSHPLCKKTRNVHTCRRPRPRSARQGRRC